MGGRVFRNKKCWFEYKSTCLYEFVCGCLETIFAWISSYTYHTGMGVHPYESSYVYRDKVFDKMPQDIVRIGTVVLALVVVHTCTNNISIYIIYTYLWIYAINMINGRSFVAIACACDFPKETYNMNVFCKWLYFIHVHLCIILFLLMINDHQKSTLMNECIVKMKIMLSLMIRVL